MRRKLAVVQALLVSTTLLLATACGNGDETGNGNGVDNGNGGPDLVRVGLIPIIDVAPLVLGESLGFFADRDIELEIDYGAGGAVIVPMVLSGDIDIGFSNLVSMMAAPPGQIKVISNGNNSTGVDGEDFGSLMVPTDSAVQSPADLAGATIGINTRSAIAEVVVNASLRQAGLEPDDVEYVAVEFPSMADELAAGNIDAAFPVEPFQTIIRNGEIGRSIASSWVDAAPDLTVAVYFTSTELIGSNPDLIDRFVAAMQESLAYADANEQEVRDFLPEYTALTPELAAEVTLPTWPSEINRESTQTLAELSLTDGILVEAPDLAALLP